MAELSVAPIVSVDRALSAEGTTTVVCDVRAYLDGRDGYEAFLAGHIPGARHLNLETELCGAPGPGIGRHPLPDPEVFATALGKAGIDPEMTVLAYDDAGGMIAGRLVWMLRSLGQNAALLDGGIGAWPGDLEVGPVEVQPVDCPVRELPADCTVTAEEVDDFIETGGVVVDARGPGRFAGEVEPIDAVAGHVPGAVNRPFAFNLSDGHFRSLGDLAAEFTDLGIDDQTIHYCGSGVSACNNMLVAEATGLGRGRLYVGSWSGYCTR